MSFVQKKCLSFSLWKSAGRKVLTSQVTFTKISTENRCHRCPNTNEWCGVAEHACGNISRCSNSSRFKLNILRRNLFSVEKRERTNMFVVDHILNEISYYFHAIFFDFLSDVVVWPNPINIRVHLILFYFFKLNAENAFANLRKNIFRKLMTIFGLFTHIQVVLSKSKSKLMCTIVVSHDESVFEHFIWVFWKGFGFHCSVCFLFRQIKALNSRLGSHSIGHWNERAFKDIIYEMCLGRPSFQNERKKVGPTNEMTVVTSFVCLLSRLFLRSLCRRFYSFRIQLIRAFFVCFIR